MCPISTPRSPGRRGCPSRRAACAKSGPISCRRAEAERMDARRAVEQAARDSYGRLLAFLAARSRDVAAAEDALGDAFRAALEAWPRTGVPEKPEAWLLTAARRRLTDGARHARVQADSVPTLLAAAEEAQALASTETLFPDERLALLFICAHPAINAAARTPLMLQTVLGLDAARIASAFLVQPAAMGQRLSRAKAKIHDAGIAFAVPEASELAPRLDAVLEAIYAAYGSGWDDVAGADPRRRHRPSRCHRRRRSPRARRRGAAPARSPPAPRRRCRRRGSWPWRGSGAAPSPPAARETPRRCARHRGRARPAASAACAPLR